DRARPLPRRQRHLVHAGRVRHLYQPQEHHRHPDGDRADPAVGQHQPRRLLCLPRRSRRPGIRDVRAHGGGGRGGDRLGHPRHLLPLARHDLGRRRQQDERL
ncbi:MAG: NADH-ubiquinone oxidoreductase chain K, partial [uncultured Sphingomonadaceae bacterium]